mgnify:CR=1 FL=1
MIQTGIVTNSKYEKNRDGSRDVLMLQVRLTSKEDVQSVEFFQGQGDAYRPENGSKVLVIDNGPAYKIAIAVDDMFAMALEVGERAIASVVDGQLKASVLCKADGDLVLNGGEDYAVQFTALKSKIDALTAQIQSHIHPSSSGTISPSLTVFDGDISAAKVDDVRLGLTPVIEEEEEIND